MSKKIQIASRQTRYEDAFIRLSTAYYKGGNDHQGEWSYIERTHETRAAIVIPVLPKTHEIILIRQFRIPVNGFVIEFPAGLIDAGERVEDAALRELLEETGYTGEVREVSPLLATSAGLTSEGIFLIYVLVNDTPLHQELEDSEDIEVLRLPLKNIMVDLRKRAEHGDLIDSKVWSLLAFSSLWQ